MSETACEPLHPETSRSGRACAGQGQAFWAGWLVRVDFPENAALSMLGQGGQPGQGYLKVSTAGIRSGSLGNSRSNATSPKDGAGALSNLIASFSIQGS